MVRRDDSESLGKRGELLKEMIRTDGVRTNAVLGLVERNMEIESHSMGGKLITSAQEEVIISRICVLSNGRTMSTKAMVA